MSGVDALQFLIHRWLTCGRSDARDPVLEMQRAGPESAAGVTRSEPLPGEAAAMEGAAPAVASARGLQVFEQSGDLAGVDGSVVGVAVVHEDVRLVCTGGRLGDARHPRLEL